MKMKRKGEEYLSWFNIRSLAFFPFFIVSVVRIVLLYHGFMLKPLHLKIQSLQFYIVPVQSVQSYYTMDSCFNLFISRYSLYSSIQSQYSPYSLIIPWINALTSSSQDIVSTDCSSIQSKYSPYIVLLYHGLMLKPLHLKIQFLQFYIVPVQSVYSLIIPWIHA